MLCFATLFVYHDQVWEREERERKRTEAKRLREEERMIEEIDLYERGLSAR